jgi:two-component sensor histidine kinase
MLGAEAVDRIVSPKSGSQRWFERYPRGMPFAVFLLTLAVTVLAVFAIERAERQRRQAQINETANGVVAALERRVNAHAAYLRSGAVLFSALPVTRESFTAFARASSTDESASGTEGSAWAELVPKSAWASLEAAERAVYPDFTIAPRPAVGQRFAVVDRWAFSFTNPDAHPSGYNLYADPARRAAFDEAMQSDRPVVSGMLTLRGGAPSGARRGFLVVMPVFDPGGPTSASTVRGFLYSGFRADKLLEGAARQENAKTLGLALYDGKPTASNRMAAIGGFAERGDSVYLPVNLARTSYVLAAQAPPGVTLSTMSILTLLFGMLVAALLTIVATLVSRKAAEDRAALLWFQEQASIRNSLTRELNHRVKNTLANVLSIVALTRRRAVDVESFADSLNGRIRALSATHDLLTQSEWGTTPILQLIGAELAPYTRDGDHTIDLLGPDVELAPNDALSLGLAIHELATNAAKYGALSVPGGRLRIVWTMISEDLARIEWNERGGPAVAADRARGFGTELIEKIVAHELGRPVDLRFGSEGVDCVLTVPVRKPAAFRIRAGA